MQPSIDTLDAWAARHIKGFIRYEAYINEGEKCVDIHTQDLVLHRVLCNKYVLDVIELRAIEHNIWIGEISTLKDRPETLVMHAGELPLREARIPDTMSNIVIRRTFSRDEFLKRYSDLCGLPVPLD